MTLSGVSKFGRVALDLGFLNIKQLEECLQLQIDFQKAGKEVPRLGSVMLSKKYITSEQLKTILEKQKDSKYETASASSKNILQFFSAGTYIFKEGENTNKQLYLIHEGCVDFYRNDKFVESRSGKGKFFGEVAFLTSKIYTVSAVTSKDSKIFVIPQKEVDSFLKNKPEMGLKIAKKIAEDFHNFIVESNPDFVKPNLSPSHSATETNSKSSNVLIEDHNKNKSEIESDTNANNSSSTISIEAIKAKALEARNKANTNNITKIDEETNINNTVNELPSTQLAENNNNEGEENLENINNLSNEYLDKKEILHYDLSNTNLEDEIEYNEPVLTLKKLSDEDVHKRHIVSSSVDCSELIRKIDELIPTPFQKEIVSVVKDIVNIYINVDEIDKERTEFLNSINNPSEILKNEINRQKKEANRVPPLESLENSYTRLKDILENNDSSEKVNNSNQTDKNNEELSKNTEEEISDGNDSSGNEVKNKIDGNLKEAYSFSLRQKKLLLNRYGILPDVLKVCASYSLNEPFFKLLKKVDIDPTRIFGWGVYQMALEEYSSIQTEKINLIRTEREEIEDSLKSLVGRLKLSKKVEEEREERFSDLLTKEKKYKLIQTVIRREIQLIEKTMVDEFWKVYFKLSHIFVSKLSDIDKVMAKCFLRWGLLGYTSKWIDKERCINFITECSKDLYAPIYSTSSKYILYADEVIELTAKGFMPTSPNEDLELNHRNSPEWRCDKGYKRYCHLKLQYGTLIDVLQAQKNEVKSIAENLKDAQEHEIVLRKSHSKTPQHREKVSAVKQEIQGYKVRSTRVTSIIDKINNEILPKIMNDVDSAISSIEKSGVKLVVSKIIDHEVNCIKRYSRLVAKLKESFLPFMLRDNYKAGSDIINSREYVTELFDDAEIKDNLIFQTNLIPSAKKKQRILVHKPPFIMIAPACGILGFVISPSSGIENGRLTLPGYFEKSMISKEVFTTVLADFRFDCSKADAGVDIMTSDTLVAAYATYRWNMRKKKKDIRKKSAVYLEETERLNWRRHYILYMNSALESGKYLFFKCPELYDVIINKFIDLPDECEKLKR